MLEETADSAAALVPSHASLESLRAAAACCRACPLWRTGTRTVFGEGPTDRPVMYVGEQPGDVEDREGRPFIGPAGRLLERALSEAGLARAGAYLTNAVKHYKWEERGRRRLHQKPDPLELSACRPWLDAELELVKPRALVCLGDTAAQALLGRDFEPAAHRGRRLASPLAPLVFATVHPSSILREPDEKSRRRAYAAFVDDLKEVAAAL
jgi:uracil-DNA glycosylase